VGPEIFFISKHQTIASECIFSKAGDVITCKRNTLVPSKADTVIFLMDNL